MTDKDYPERWIDVYDTYEGRFRCRIEDEPRLDAEYSAFLDSGRTKDKLIELTLLSGATMKLAVSSIATWMIATLEQAQESIRANLAFVNVMKEIDPDFAADGD